MNPLRTATGLLHLPAHAAAAVAGTAVGVVTTGVRTSARLLGWTVERVGGTVPARTAAPWAHDTPAAPETAEAPPVQVPEAPATQTPVAEDRTAEAPARKAAAEQAAAKKAPAKKAPVKKAPARKVPSRQAAVVAPALGLTESEAEDILRTPSGIPAAGDGINPDTTEVDLHQPGTEPLMDPATTKAVASEFEVLRRAADPDKG
ncbi:hypothetical protein F4692_002739 [Nocardioides cavernae]|uniref:Uncharacterized protein n=1 Tax=Nocardioides cavernae TaxID=1921566 RepID=A0A7Y9H4N4_9ACTN|nr:hypothetical protein [Nocardioides cavernae]NYE37606.1 hypothetical protein [Nocardioides cavernae]